jgi:hypothetical protein
MRSDKDHLKGLKVLLEQDSKSLQRKYPIEALHAINDEKVSKAISARFDKGSALKSIKSLGRNNKSGIVEICFEFSGDKLLQLSPDLVLSILNNSNQVIGIVDPFEPPQSHETPGDLPFVLHMPSAAQDFAITAEESANLEARTKQYLGDLSPGAAATRFSGDIYYIGITPTKYPGSIPKCRTWTGRGEGWEGGPRCDEVYHIQVMWPDTKTDDAGTPQPP